MCQDCTGYDTYADDDLGYDDQDDGWGDDGYEDEPDPPEETGPDPWDYHPSLLERFRWWLKAREHVGRGVVYRTERNAPEDGMITGVSASYVFVRYAGDQHSKASHPADLEFLAGVTGG